MTAEPGLLLVQILYTPNPIELGQRPRSCRSSYHSAILSHNFVGVGRHFRLRWSTIQARCFLKLILSNETRSACLTQNWLFMTSRDVQDVNQPVNNVPYLGATNIFVPRVYPKGSLVIALVRVCVCPSLDISETAH